MEAEFYNIKFKLYLGLFSVKTLFMPSFALDTIWRSNLGLLHGCQSPDCVWVKMNLSRFTKCMVCNLYQVPKNSFIAFISKFEIPKNLLSKTGGVGIWYRISIVSK